MNLPKQIVQDKDQNHTKPNQERAQAYMKYSGMAIQMGIIILIGAFIGKKLDAYFQTERPYLTSLFALIAIFAALYLSLKDLFGSK